MTAVRAIDYRADADDAAFRAACALDDELEREVRGGGAVVEPPESVRARWAAWSDQAVEVAVAQEGNRVVGAVTLRRPLEDDTSEARVDVRVAAGARRRGIGSLLLAWALERAAVHRLVSLRSGYDIAVGAGSAHGAGDAFATRHGFTVYDEVWSQDLDLTCLPPVPVTPGYTQAACLGMPPREWWDGLAVLQARMATDAVFGDQDARPEAWDAARVQRAWSARTQFERVGATGVSLDGAGTPVAFSTMGVREGEGIVRQDDTLVLPEHRGHGLGLATKLAALHRVRGAVPEVTVGRTENSIHNAPMLRVNEALGYRPRTRAVFVRRPL